MNVTHYRQVKLARDHANGMRDTQVAWVPDHLGRVGQRVKLKNEDGTWDEGWHVAEAWSRMTAEYVLAHERDYLKQAEASDLVEWKKLEIKE